MFKTAIRFILYDKPKSIGALFGVVISIFLIGQQTGIFIFLTGMMSSLVDNINTDIWVVDNRTTNVAALGQIDARYQRQIEALPGIDHVYPLVITGAAAKFNDGKSGGITLVGSQSPAFVGGPWKISGGTTENLLLDNAVTTDVFDKKLLGDAKMGTQFEIGGKLAKVTLQTNGARGFGASFVFTTIDRARYYSKFPREKVSALLIKVKPGADLKQITQMIDNNMFGVKSWTKKDFSAATVSTILGSSGIATSVGTLIIFAIIAGSIIIGLTLYSAATDRLKDYATLKAIGATNAYVRNLILTQALIFALIGYIIGVLLMYGFKLGIAKAGIMFSYSISMYIAFAVVTLVISMIGVIAAIRRIVKVEPASVFRG
jgi:putative ABC transport system permease protein